MRLLRLIILSPVVSLFIACGGGQPPVYEQYTAFNNPEVVTVTGYSGSVMEPFISRDGLYLFFNNEAPGDKDIYYATFVGATTFSFAGEVKGVNHVGAVDGVPTMDIANTFYYVTTAFYQNPPPHYDTVYSGVFDPATGNVNGIAAVDGVAEDIAGHLNFDVEISSDGNTLYAVDGIFSGNAFPDEANIFIAVKNAANTFVRLANSATIMANINTNDLEYAPGISADGLELFFTRLRLSDFDTRIYRAVRPSTSTPFGRPQYVSAISGFVEGPALSPDEKSLYYHKRDGSAFVLYRVTRP